MSVLYINQKIFKITDHYPVTNHRGQTVYQVDQDFTLIGARIRVKNKKNKRSFVIKKKLISLFPQYHVHFDDGKSFTIKQRLSFFRKVDLVSRDYKFRLKGNLFDTHFEVFDGKENIGYVEKEFFSLRDRFAIHVNIPSYEEELLALVIALDHMQDTEEKQRNRA